MPNELDKLMLATVSGKQIADGRISRLEFESEFEQRDYAVVTVDSEVGTADFKHGEHLEIKLQSKVYVNAQLFNGTIEGIEPKFQSGRTTQIVIRGFSPKRIWQMPTVFGKEIPLEVPQPRVASLIVRVVPISRQNMHFKGWDPEPLVREPRAILGAEQAEKLQSMAMLHMELQLASPSAEEVVTYTLDKYLQINALDGAFKNPRGFVRRVKVSADRDNNAVKLILGLRGAVPAHCLLSGDG